MCTLIVSRPSVTGRFSRGCVRVGVSARVRVPGMATVQSISKPTREN